MHDADHGTIATAPTRSAGRRLRIAVVAHLRHPIAEPFTGGMESYVWRLTKALQRRGHDVTLFASGDSDPSLPLEPAIDRHYDLTFPWRTWHDTKELHDWLDALWPGIVRRIAGGGFDVVHNNSLHPAPIAWSTGSGRPVVTTLHVPPFHTLREAVRRADAAWTLFTLPSAAQIPRWWDGHPAGARVVPNGLDLGAWPFRRSGDGSCVWCGRIAPNKAPALAAEAARLAGLPLVLYGPIEDQNYFNQALAPLLGPAIRYGGHVVQAALADAVGRASVALFTPMWDEPFGLTAVEAMACGVPVAAFDNGAAREVIGPCGRFAPPGDTASLAVAIGEAADLSREACRARVAALFSEAAMIDAFEALYVEAMARSPEAAVPRQARRSFNLRTTQEDEVYG